MSFEPTDNHHANESLSFAAADVPTPRPRPRPWNLQTSEATLSNYPNYKAENGEEYGAPGPIVVEAEHYHEQRSRSFERVLSSGQTNLFVTLILLTLLGLRPQRLEAQLRTNSAKAWEDFRDSLVKKWGTIMITTGLVLGAATAVMFSDKVQGVPYLMAVASLASSIVSITFGTGLTFVTSDAPVETFMKLAQQPAAMVFILSTPTLFAIAAMLSLYASITAVTYQNLDVEAINILARVGTTGGAALMVLIFVASAWLVRGLDKSNQNEHGKGTARA